MKQAEAGDPALSAPVRWGTIGPDVRFLTNYDIFGSGLTYGDSSWG